MHSYPGFIYTRQIDPFPKGKDGGVYIIRIGAAVYRHPKSAAPVHFHRQNPAPLTSASPFSNNGTASAGGVNIYPRAHAKSAGKLKVGRVPYVHILVYPVEFKAAADLSVGPPDRVVHKRPVMAIPRRVVGDTARTLIELPIADRRHRRRRGDLLYNY